jgi:hypothetical protein
MHLAHKYPRNDGHRDTKYRGEEISERRGHTACNEAQLSRCPERKVYRDHRQTSNDHGQEDVRKDALPRTPIEDRDRPCKRRRPTDSGNEGQGSGSQCSKRNVEELILRRKESEHDRNADERSNTVYRSHDERIHVVPRESRDARVERPMPNRTLSITVRSNAQPGIAPDKSSSDVAC